MSDKSVLICSAGIAGLAAAVACDRAGMDITVTERTAAFGEVAAGIQIGPNVTRILQPWGLDAALKRLASLPDALSE